MSLSSWRENITSTKKRLVTQKRVGRRLEKWALAMGMPNSMTVDPSSLSVDMLRFGYQVNDKENSLHVFTGMVQSVIDVIGPPDQIGPVMNDNEVSALHASWDIEVDHVRGARVKVYLFSPKDCKLKPGTGRPKIDVEYLPAELHPECSAVLKEME